MTNIKLLTAGLATTVDAPDIDDSTSFWRWDFAWEVLPTMLSSFFKVTLVVTVVGTVIAAILGLVIAIMIRLLPRPLAWLVTWIANFIRMTPIVVQLLIVFYGFVRSEEHTSELQSRGHLVCRLLLEKKRL